MTELSKKEGQMYMIYYKFIINNFSILTAKKKHGLLIAKVQPLLLF